MGATRRITAPSGGSKNLCGRRRYGSPSTRWSNQPAGPGSSLKQLPAASQKVNPEQQCHPPKQDRADGRLRHFPPGKMNHRCLPCLPVGLQGGQRPKVGGNPGIGCGVDFAGAQLWSKGRNAGIGKRRLPRQLFGRVILAHLRRRDGCAGIKHLRMGERRRGKE